MVANEVLHRLARAQHKHVTEKKGKVKAHGWVERSTRETNKECTLEKGRRTRRQRARRSRVGERTSCMRSALDFCAGVGSACQFDKRGIKVKSTIEVDSWNRVVQALRVCIQGCTHNHAAV